MQKQKKKPKTEKPVKRAAVRWVLQCVKCTPDKRHVGDFVNDNMTYTKSLYKAKLFSSRYDALLSRDDQRGIAERAVKVILSIEIAQK